MLIHFVFGIHSVAKGIGPVCHACGQPVLSGPAWHDYYRTESGPHPGRAESARLARQVCGSTSLQLSKAQPELKKSGKLVAVGCSILRRARPVCGAAERIRRLRISGSEACFRGG